MSVFKTVVILALSLLFKRSVHITAALCGFKLHGSFGLDIIPKLLPLYVEYSLSFSLEGGAELMLDGGRPKKLKKRRKHGRGIRLVNALEVKRARVKGAVGIAERPDLGVICAGALQTLFVSAAAVLTGKRPEVSIVPELKRSVFDLYVEGIVCISSGRLIREVILSRRRTA
ncbi:MAG: hypothetical protein IKP26_05930 [Clostridia bacterium]|nr:hypothetical protein [Clostridia bacterium]